jgi:hypothetical protein
MLNTCKELTLKLSGFLHFKINIVYNSSKFPPSPLLQCCPFLFWFWVFNTVCLYFKVNATRLHKDINNYLRCIRGNYIYYSLRIKNYRVS